MKLLKVIHYILTGIPIIYLACLGVLYVKIGFREELLSSKNLDISILHEMTVNLFLYSAIALIISFLLLVIRFFLKDKNLKCIFSFVMIELVVYIVTFFACNFYDT